MIVKVKKYLFIGAREDIHRFFRRAQRRGCIEFLSSGGEGPLSLPDKVRKSLLALKILRSESVRSCPPPVDQEECAMDQVIDSVIETKRSLEQEEEREKELLEEIDAFSPLGEFSMQEVNALREETGYSFQFFCGKFRDIPLDELDQCFLISEEREADYFLSVCKQPRLYPGCVELHPSRSLRELREEYLASRRRKEKYQGKLRESVGYLDLLEKHLKGSLNHHHLIEAIHKVDYHMDDSLFSIEGWVPSHQESKLFPLLEGLAIVVEEGFVGKGEKVPTCFKNRGYGAVGEDLVRVYDTPSTEDKDPSIWVLWAFVIFFSLAISDAGYGLIYLIAAVVLKKCFPCAREGARRFFRLLTMISFSCLVWGILSCSYFGLDFRPNHPAHRLSVLSWLSQKKAEYHLSHRDRTYQLWVSRFPHLSEVNTASDFLLTGVETHEDVARFVIFDDFRDIIFMEIALWIGAIHICIALCRYLPYRYANFGWVLAIAGAFLLFPEWLHATSISHFMGWVRPSYGCVLGKQLLFGGMGLALFLSFFQRGWRGCTEVTRPIEIFSDVLSYLRLYALGLSGMILASTFNDMGRKIGLVPGVIVVLIGHGINIIVGAMGGTIHGLRLNFIEWYHHCFQGGGRVFNPLRLLK